VALNHLIHTPFSKRPRNQNLCLAEWLTVAGEDCLHSGNANRRHWKWRQLDAIVPRNLDHDVLQRRTERCLELCNYFPRQITGIDKVGSSPCRLREPFNETGICTTPNRVAAILYGRIRPNLYHQHIDHEMNSLHV
jgi:hypothetical protein